MEAPPRHREGRRQALARDVLFSNLVPELRLQLRVDSDSYRYITAAAQAAQINQIYAQILGPLEDLVLTDLTAGVGGDVIDAAGRYRLVHAIELMPQRYAHLRHNLELLGLTERVCLYQGDAVALLRARTWTQDAIFFDPPWAGSGSSPRGVYHPHLSFSGILLEVWVEELLRDHARLVGIKLPRTYDFRHWADLQTRYHHARYHLGSFYLLCFWHPLTSSPD